jgi:hypothetical protein
LCKVFLKGEKNISDDIQENSDNADSPKDNFEAYLQYLAKIEEQRVSQRSFFYLIYLATLL